MYAEEAGGDQYILGIFRLSRDDHYYFHPADKVELSFKMLHEVAKKLIELNATEFNN